MTTYERASFRSVQLCGLTAETGEFRFPSAMVSSKLLERWTPRSCSSRSASRGLAAHHLIQGALERLAWSNPRTETGLDAPINE